MTFKELLLSLKETTLIWGRVILIISPLWAVFSFSSCRFLILFQRKLASNPPCVKNVIFPVALCQLTDRTTSWLSQFTQMKRLLFFRVQQGPHGLRSESIDFLLSWLSLIYRSPFESVCASFILFHFFICVCLLFPHYAGSLKESLGGATDRAHSSIVPASDHGAAGSARAAFIDFRLCRVSRGYPVILDLDRSKGAAGEAVGEAAFLVVGTA